jgi:hypothetical protein
LRKNLNGNSAMRETKTGGWMELNASGALVRGLRLALVALGIGLVMTVGAARAQDEEDDDRTFEEKIIENLRKGLGGTNMEKSGIDYRERSPLVVPPRIDLPPPASVEPKAANWPKDPDEARRKAAIARRKKENKDPMEAARPLKPSELEIGRTAAPARTNNDPVEPGVSTTPVLSPSQLGFDGRISSFFKGNPNETVPFKGEPTRESLTQPPAGYQTPSPNFAYGTGPKESLNTKKIDRASGQPIE